MDPSLRWGDGDSCNASFQRRLESIDATRHPRWMKQAWVYIMTNKRHGTLYTGVTSNLPARVTQHRDGTGSEFCSKYGLKTLVYAEPHARIDEAIAREKAIKAWQRTWKIRLIEEANPDWEDLYDWINC
jgi:putative endonuclease